MWSVCSSLTLMWRYMMRAFKPTKDTVMTPKPNKEQIKKLYKAFGGNPNGGKLPELLEIIDNVYDSLFPNGEVS